MAIELAMTPLILAKCCPSLGQSNHSCHGGLGERQLGGLGTSVSMSTSSRLLQCSTGTSHHSTSVHIASGASKQQGRGGGPLAGAMAYSTALTSFVATSHNIHNDTVSSLSLLQSQSTLISLQWFNAYSLISIISTNKVLEKYPAHNMG